MQTGELTCVCVCECMDLWSCVCVNGYMYEMRTDEYIYIYIYMLYIYIYMYMHTHTHTFTHTHTHIYTHTHTRTHTRTFTHTYTHTVYEIHQLKFCTSILNVTQKLGLKYLWRTQTQQQKSFIHTHILNTFHNISEKSARRFWLTNICSVHKLRNRNHSYTHTKHIS